MKASTLLSIVVLIAASGAVSAGERFTLYDRYEHLNKRDQWSMSMRTLVLDGDSGAVAVEVSVAHRGCSGTLTGIGRLDGGFVTLEPYRKEDAADQCLVTIKFENGGKLARINGSRCSYWHGASCEFVGEVEAVK